MKRIIGILIILLLLYVAYILFVPLTIPVITYHDFVQESVDNNMQITEDEFEKEMKYLSDHHYKTISLKDMKCYLEKKCKLSRKAILITMDDGWINELKIAAPILKKYDLHAVIFYVGEHLDDDNPNFMHRDDIELLQKEYPNIELASHSYRLHFEDAYKLSKDELEEDMKLMKEEITSSYYAYPYGRYSKDYQEALKEEGYSLAFTFGPDGEHRKVKQSDSTLAIPRLNMSQGMPLWKFVLRINWYK